MAKPKKKGADPVSFIKGFLTKPENKSPVSNYLRTTTKRDEMLKKIRGK